MNNRGQVEGKCSGVFFKCQNFLGMFGKYFQSFSGSVLFLVEEPILQ